MTRGEIWTAQAARKRRTVLILTRSEVIDARELVTVAEITTSTRGLAAEVELDLGQTGLDEPSVIDCDGLHTIGKATLTRRVGANDSITMDNVCWAVGYAIGC